MGNGSQCVVNQILSQGATPYTRGSTSGPTRLRPTRPGYPVHAGIDPQTESCARAPPRLPRTRGDRPPKKCSHPPFPLATPYTRGSTVLEWILEDHARGYPVHAGIDPLASNIFAEITRLPRTRGDRPSAGNSWEGMGMATPYTRGSTLVEVPEWGGAVGYPVHAGIDPFLRAFSKNAVRLPRTRGDRPLDRSFAISSALATPYTRGSTFGYGLA